MNNVKTKYFIVFLINLLILFCTFIAFRFRHFVNFNVFFFYTKLIFIFVITFYTALARHLCPAHLVSR